MVDRLSVVRGAPKGSFAHYQAFGFALVSRFYAQCAESARIRSDYLIQLTLKWYRGDTNRAHSAFFFAARGRSSRIEAPLEREQRIDALARADLERATAIDEHLGRAWA